MPVLPLLQICLLLFPGDSLWPLLFYVLFAQSQIASLCSLTFCLIINQAIFACWRHIFVSWPYFYFVAEFHLSLKYKLYSRLTENYSFSFFGKSSMNKGLMDSTGHIQKTCNSVEQQVNDIWSNLLMVLDTHPSVFNSGSIIGKYLIFKETIWKTNWNSSVEKNVTF